MSRAAFEVAYDGEALSGHQMDVRTLAPALLSIGDLIQEANAELNKNKTSVNVLVKSNFEHKCFNIDFELVQTLYQQIRDFFGDEEVKNAKEILEWIGLLSGPISISLLGYLKLRKGREIENATVIEEEHGDNKIQLQFKGDHNTVTLNQYVYNLGENQKIRDAVNGVIEPLEREGINELVTRESGVETGTFDKAAAEDIKRSCGPIDDEPEEEFEPQHIEAHLRIYSPVYDEKADRWRFSYGSDHVWVDISETNIAADVIDRGGIMVGDVYKVSLEITEYKTKSGQFRKRYKIVEVLEFIPSPTQRRLGI